MPDKPKFNVGRRVIVPFIKPMRSEMRDKNLSVPEIQELSKHHRFIRDLHRLAYEPEEIWIKRIKDAFKKEKD